MDALGLLVRIGLVFALLGATLWAVRRADQGRSATRGSAPVQLLSTTRLAKGASISLVRIGGAAYALGVTEHGVTLLTETELPAPAVDPVAEPVDPLRALTATPTGPPSFASALQSQLGALAHPGRHRAGTAPGRSGGR